MNLGSLKIREALPVSSSDFPSFEASLLPVLKRMQLFLRPPEYVREALVQSLERKFGPYELTDSPEAADLQWADYEDLDFQAALDDPKRWVCAYSIRKALIRKHFLNQTVREYVAKNPSSVLSTAVPESWNLEVDYAEFLDDALDEAFELRGELELNEDRSEEKKRWFILKPGMSERGAGLRLFSTIAELTEIFEDNEPDDGEEQETEAGDTVTEISGAMAGLMTSNMRFFVVQEYLAQPLLLASLQGRKFHIRAYVLCVGALTVYVHRNLLVLSSSQVYSGPSFNVEELGKHLTNTCYQTALSSSSEESTVQAFWALTDPDFEQDSLWTQMKQVTHDLFDAACAQRINFQALPNAFEIFGVDFLVDSRNSVSLLEVNAYPDFSQTGEALTHLVDKVILDTVELVAESMYADPVAARHVNLHLDSGYELCFDRKIL